MALALPLLLRSGSFLFVPVPPLASSSFRIHPQPVQNHLSQLARSREHQRAVCAQRGGASNPGTSAHSNRDTEGGSGETTRADGGRAVPLGHGGDFALLH